jgi:hypothetical protein
MLNLFKEFFGIAHAFEEQGIRYAVIGGFAMAFHNLIRATDDLDYLILTDDVEKAIALAKGAGFNESGAPITFQSSGMTLHRLVKFMSTDHIIVDLLSGNTEEYHDIISNAVVIDAGDGPVHVAAIDDLIRLKQKRGSVIDNDDIRRLRGTEGDDSQR